MLMNSWSRLVSRVVVSVNCQDETERSVAEIWMGFLLSHAELLFIVHCWSFCSTSFFTPSVSTLPSLSWQCVPYCTNKRIQFSKVAYWSPFKRSNLPIGHTLMSLPERFS
ncbi:hypothetical protein NPIL_461501 [Nephila pilipes]|uniref:Uncharacterized protein n=1 Tax=Nephila pilipes TaxID=299642 RepID=A0A8X6JRW0_NEPPI|nr:hypothetical protein NPIL_461501 [Nephila pilipes]